MNDKTLDCSDIDRHLGKPIESAHPFEPVAINDIRRWAQAMHYPNRLHYDRDFARASRFGELVAPPSFAISQDDGHGAAPACVGRIPHSHLVFGGDEWWFSGKQIKPGDLITNQRIPFDYVVKETKFAGPTCFQRGDNHYYNQHGDLIATQRSTSIRYRPDLAREMQAMTATDDPEWTDAQIEELEARKMEYIRALHELGHGKRSFAAVGVGDKLPVRVIGPHSVASFATEWRAYTMNTWGAMRRRTDLDLQEVGFEPELGGHEGDPEMELLNPEMTDGAYYGPSRGHLFPRWARFIGMPRGYGYGASMGAWILDYLAGWAGEWGQLLHCNAQYRGPAFTGDITVMEGEITGREKDEENRNVVHVDFRMSTQDGVVMATARAELALPD